MKDTAQCRRAAALLADFEPSGALDCDETDLVFLATHLEQCRRCGPGVEDETLRQIVGGVRSLGDDLSSPFDGVQRTSPESAALAESFWEESRAGIMEAVRAEPTSLREGARSVERGDRRGPEGRQDGRSAAAVSLPAGPRRGFGVGLSLAAAAAIFLATGVLGLRTVWEMQATQEANGVLASRPGGTLESLEDAALASSEDAWLVAGSDFYPVALNDDDTGWGIEELSAADLDSLEGLLGSAPEYDSRTES